MCSGFGVEISCCLKEFSVMIIGTLDGFYPNFMEIIIVCGILVVSIIAQSIIISVMIEFYSAHKVYAAYYLTNVIAGFIAALGLFGEVLEDFNVSLSSLIIVVIANLMILKVKILQTKELILPS